MAIPHRKYLLIPGVAFAVWWTFLAIAPWHRDVWLTENALVFAAVVALLAGFHRKLLFSRVSYTLIFVFMCLHQVGAHYSYAEVPYEAWFQNMTGATFSFLPLDLTMSSSMLFELLEWLVADVFGGGLGQAYLGTQGDVWDAHRDMGLASLGALIAMLITVALNWRFQRDFNREWADSFRVKHKAPLGEDELERMTRKHQRKHR